MASGGPTIEIGVGQGDKEKVRQFAGLRGFKGRSNQPDMTAYILQLMLEDMSRALQQDEDQPLRTASAVQEAEPRLHPDDAEELRNLAWELNRTGVLLNQMAKAVNTIARGGGSSFDAARAERMIGELDRLAGRVERLFTRIESGGRNHVPAALPTPAEGAPAPAAVPQGRGRSRPADR